MNLLCSLSAAIRHNRYWGRFILVPLILFAWVALYGQACAALLLYEPFDYPADESINNKNGGTGFVPDSDGVWNRSPQTYSDQITNGGLTFQNLLTSGNALVSHVAGGADNDGHQSIRRISPVPLTESSSYWFSFLMTLDSIPEGGSVADFEGYVALMPASSGYSLRVGVSRGSTSISVTSSMAASPVYSSPDPIAIGQTYFVVLHIEGDGTVTLYIDPAPGTSAPSELSEIGGGILSLPGQFSRLGVFSSEVGASWIFDEFRLGTTYLDVAPIPEPSHLGLLILGGGLLLIVFYRGRSQSAR